MHTLAAYIAGLSLAIAVATQVSEYVSAALLRVAGVISGVY